uniref:Uncharacterized protein n=1 Tax=Arundo donax TaxID=35708 RepID=A0A0A8Z018_ARUDO
MAINCPVTKYLDQTYHYVMSPM